MAQGEEPREAGGAARGVRGLGQENAGERIADLGYEAYAASPAEFASFIGEETHKWAKIVKISGAKVE